MVVDWGQCEAQQLVSLQKDASVILTILGDSSHFWRGFDVSIRGSDR